MSSPEISLKQSRRRFLRNAAAISGAGLMAGPGLAAERSLVGKNARASQTDFDVVVIGGGFSGVTAARDSSKAGLRTLLLEARNRLGGRTYDTQFRGHHIELGGTWVHWTQAAVWAEILRYGLETDIVETPGAVPDRIIALVDGKPLEVATADKITEVLQGIEAYYADAEVAWGHPYSDAQARWPEITSRDRLTAADRLAALKLTDVQKSVVASFVESISHCPIEQASYVEQLRAWTMLNRNVGLAFEVLARYKLKSGTGNLIRRMIADGNATVRLGSPVRRVEQRKDVVLVTSGSNETVSARAVILALPIRVLQHIDFSPALAADKKAASESGFTASGVKYYAEVSGRVGNIQCFAPGRQNPAGMFFTYEALPAKTLLVGFSPYAQGFDANDEDAVQKAFRQFLPDIEVTGSTSYAWGTDPFALGTYNGFRPGSLSALGASLARREGRVFMAGGDIGLAPNSYRSFITGAIEAGTRAAREVREALS